MGRERELKLTVEEGFTLPDLQVTVAGAAPEPGRERLVADCYFDSVDLRLARWGCTLRHRDGEGWTVKIPVASTGSVLDREEVTFAGELGPPPAETLQLVASLTRGATVEQQAQLCTHRTAYRWCNPSGALVLELVDDRVRADTPSGHRAAFRQLEVELAPDADERLLDPIVDRLVAAGARIDRPVPKLVQALGSRAEAPPDVIEPVLAVEPTGREVIHAALARSTAHLLLHLPVARLGDDPEGVHQARVAIRRIRSDLRTFGPLIEPTWAASLQDELRWLAGELGRVRDADVLLERLTGTIAAHPEIDAGAAQHVIDALAAERAADRASLLDHLDRDRATQLLDRLVSAANDPRTAPQADDPATERLGQLVRKRWRRLQQAVEALGPEPELEQLHRIRILAKRARYSAQAVTPAYPDDAPRFAKAIARITDVLGELNDACVAEGWLAGRADRLAPDAVFAAGRLAQVVAVEGSRRLPSWEDAYRRASRKRLRRWFE